MSDKLPDATRQRPRQATRALAHPPTCRPGAFPDARGKRLCSQRCTVASDADKIAIVASGGVPDGPFLHYLGDADGHLMPLSPAIRVRYDTLYRWLYHPQFLFHFYPYLRCHLSVTPSAYKRRPMRNVEGGSKAEKHSRSVSLAASVYCSTQRSRARTQYTQTCSSRSVISLKSSEAR